MKSAEEWLSNISDGVSDRMSVVEVDLSVQDIRAIQADALREAAVMVRRAPLDTHYNSDAGTINRVNMADTLASKAQQLEQNEQ